MISASTLKRGRSFAAFGSALMAAVALGYAVVAQPPVAVVLGILIAISPFVLNAQLSVLIPLVSVTLLLGSSSLSISASPLVFWGKFVAIGIVGVTAILGRRAFPLRSLTPRTFGVGFLAIGIFATISSIYSLNPAVSLQHGLSLILLWLAVAVAFPPGLENETIVQRLFLTLGGIGAVASIVGFVGVGASESFVAGRFTGIFGNPNTLGYFLAPIFPGLVLLGVMGRPRRTVTTPLLVVLTFALILSGSRAGLLAAAFGTAVGLAALRKGLRSLVAVVIIGIVAVTILSVWGESVRRTSEEGLFEAGTGSGRVEAWRDGIRLANERPILGHGFATTPLMFRQSRGPVSESDHTYYLARLHNSYLEAAVDLGWPAAILLTALVGSGLLAAWRLTRGGSHSTRVLGAALTAGIAGGAVEAVFETGLLAPGGMLCFHFWLLVCAAHVFRHRSISLRKVNA